MKKRIPVARSTFCLLASLLLLQGCASTGPQGESLGEAGSGAVGLTPTPGEGSSPAPASTTSVPPLAPSRPSSKESAPLRSSSRSGLQAPSDAAAALFSPAVEDLAPPPPRVLTLDLTHDANDIWDRMRRGFRMPDLDDETVTQMQIFYLGRPGFLRQVLERARPYLFHFVEELEQKGMPTELALLPMVESAYNPMAYSRAHASGLWQFIPSTGRNYNLTQNSWVDERRDVIASTSAALDYLQTIYEMQGDWHLALASYNWGEGSVARAMQRNEAAGKPTTYPHLKMPDETRRYVPKLQALKNIIAQPELFNISLPFIPNRPYFVQVESPAGIDLGTAAHLADTPLDEFLSLNPGFNRPIIPAGGPQLVIPADKEELFRANVAEYERSGKRWQAYRLQKGDKLEQIAAQAGTSAAALRRINGLSGNGSSGEPILIPVGIDANAALRTMDMLAQRGVRFASTEKPAKSGGKNTASKSRGARNSTVKTTTSGRGKASAKPASTSSKAKAPATRNSSGKKPGKKK